MSRAREQRRLVICRLTIAVALALLTGCPPDEDPGPRCRDCHLVCVPDGNEGLCGEDCDCSPPPHHVQIIVE